MEAFKKQVSLPLLHFTFLPFFLLLHASSLAQAEDHDKPPSDCSPFHYKCRGANPFNISYPFWTDGYWDRCLLPKKEFKISCNKTDNSSEIEIQLHKYQVKEIDYENQILTVVDKDFFGSKSDDNCLSPLENTTLDFEFFKYYDEGDFNLNFLHNCTFFPNFGFGQYLNFSFLECLSNKSTKTHAYFTLQPKIPKEFEDCQVVKIPILKEYRGELETDPDAEAAWKEALRNGFQITWSPIDPWNQCGNCFRSNGHCGRNESSPNQQPICYRNGQPQTHTGPPQGENLILS